VALTLADPPGETTHRTTDAMAKASGISASSVRRIWRSHGLQPHRLRRFKLSTTSRWHLGWMHRAGTGARPSACYSPCRLTD
jgi:hypothetical protein